MASTIRSIGRKGSDRCGKKNLRGVLRDSLTYHALLFATADLRFTFFAPEASQYSMSGMTNYLPCQDQTYRVNTVSSHFVKRVIVPVAINLTKAVREVASALYKLTKA